MIASYVDLNVKDFIEILFFSAICYYFMLWLSRDRQKKLLLYFYGYCCCVAGAYYCSFATITLFLFAGSPAIIMLFIIVHQDTLQRNFVALHNLSTKTPAALSPLGWHEILIRSCLVLLHKQQVITCVIEQQQSLKSFIESSFIFETPLQQGLLEMLMQNPIKMKKESFVWLTSKGILKSIESNWIAHQTLYDNQNTTLPHWQQEALLFTAKTDALILSSSPLHGTFSFMAQGKHVEGLTADQIIRILHTYSKKSASKQGVKPYVPSPQEQHAQHPNS